MARISPKTILKGISNIPDWKTRRRIVVFESDDWGSIRMPSVEAFRRLDKAGVQLRNPFGEAERFNMYDNLATSRDLENLYEVLSSVKDSTGRPAVFTPVAIVANPDFQKIEDSGFQKYFYEPFTETLKRFPGCENAFKLWKEGIENRLFVPQMHGREHLNVPDWMRALQSGDKDALQSFREQFWGYIPVSDPDADYLAAFLADSRDDLLQMEEIIEDGLNLFEELFSYRAVFFVPPNGVFNNSLNSSLASNGIRYRSNSKIQVEALSKSKTKKRLHYHGKKGKHGIRYIIRNVVFEPSREGVNWIDTSMDQISSAFRWNKPAIISTHRVSFVGALYPENRDKGLSALSALLREIVKNWPDVEFMTTEELGALMDRS
jgi:hypothetical protein